MFEAMTTLLDQKRQTTADHLVRAAVAGLAKHGFTVTVDDIAREANVSRRTIFRHFATRDDLLAVALTQQSDNFRSTLPQLFLKRWPEGFRGLSPFMPKANAH